MKFTHHHCNVNVSTDSTVPGVRYLVISIFIYWNGNHLELSSGQVIVQEERGVMESKRKGVEGCRCNTLSSICDWYDLVHVLHVCAILAWSGRHGKYFTMFNKLFFRPIKLRFDFLPCSHCEIIISLRLLAQNVSPPNAGLDPTTPGLRVPCSTDWANRAGWFHKGL